MKAQIKLTESAEAKRLASLVDELRPLVQNLNQIGEQWESLDENSMSPVEFKSSDEKFSFEHGRAATEAKEAPLAVFSEMTNFQGLLLGELGKERRELRTKFIKHASPWFSENTAVSLYCDTEPELELELISRKLRNCFVSDGPESVLNGAERLLLGAKQFDECGSFLPQALRI